MINLAREVAARILRENGDPSRASYYSPITSQRERSLAHNLAAGSIRWRGLLDHLIATWSSRSLSKLSIDLLCALRLGAFQLLFTGIPEYAAVNSSVNLLKSPGERAYANAVLRALVRSAGYVELPCIDDDPVSYISLRYSLPEWIARLFVERFGIQTALRLADSSSRPASLTLRVNPSRTSSEEFITSLRKAGFDALECVTPDFVRLTGNAKVEALPGFGEGFFAVQDEGAGAISLALGVIAGDRVWDVCAAPGGKTTHLAQILGEKGEVLASDVDSRRVELIEQSVRRMGFPNVSTSVLDARVSLACNLKFDKVLLDAPCSGLGVLRRHPDLKWNRRESDVAKMAARQRDLLRAVAPALVVGGALVYSTCTLTKEENEDVWKEFLHENPEFHPEDPVLSNCGTSSLYKDGALSEEGCRYILPLRHPTDCFFVARAVKTENRHAS